MNNIKTKTLNIMPVYIIDQDGTKRVYVNSGLTTGEDIHVYKDIVFQIKKSLGEDSHVTLLDTDKRPIELTKMLEG